MSENLFELALPSLQNEFKAYNSLKSIAEDYGIENILTAYFLVFDIDHPDYDQRVTNLEMEFGGCNFLYHLPSEGHSYNAENYQDRLFLFEYETTIEEISKIVGSAAITIETVDPQRLLK